MNFPKKKTRLLPEPLRPFRPALAGWRRRSAGAPGKGAPLACPSGSRAFFAGLVAFCDAIRPDPIPNSAVKRVSANGTASQDVGE